MDQVDFVEDSLHDVIHNVMGNIKIYFIRFKEATGGVLLKKAFLEISQNSQMGTCARVSFLTKVQAQGL